MVARDMDDFQELERLTALFCKLATTKEHDEIQDTLRAIGEEERFEMMSQEQWAAGEKVGVPDVRMHRDKLLYVGDAKATERPSNPESHERIRGYLEHLDLLIPESYNAALFVLGISNEEHLVAWNEFLSAEVAQLKLTNSYPEIKTGQEGNFWVAYAILIPPATFANTVKRLA